MNLSANLQPVDFTTLSRVKILLGVEDADTDQDALHSSVITRISAKFTRYMRMHALRASRTEAYQLRAGQRILTLDAISIDPIASFAIRMAAKPTSSAFSDGTLLTDDDYVLNAPGGYVRLTDEEKVLGYAQVTYTGGLGTSATDLATRFEDLADACDLQVKHFLNRRDQLDGSLSIQGAGASTQVQGEYALLKDVRETLDAYARGSV